ncbi:MAG: hypothetical protein IK084_02420 [Bacteroidaceae bacterium]|nr:hypothetical protein [Bacteroidaceae bacterium]
MEKEHNIELSIEASKMERQVKKYDKLEEEVFKLRRGRVPKEDYDALKSRCDKLEHDNERYKIRIDAYENMIAKMQNYMEYLEGRIEEED